MNERPLDEGTTIGPVVLDRWKKQKFLRLSLTIFFRVAILFNEMKKKS